MILGRILCYIFGHFEQDIVFGAYLTLQAESREDVDVFKKKSKLLSQFGAEILGVQSWNPQSICQNYCVAVGCKNTAKKGSEYSFHCFPHQNPNLLKKWVHAICRKQWKPTKHSFICSDHFHESCFVIRPGAEGRRLKDDAVPSIFQTFPSYYQKDIKFRRSPRKRQYVAHERKKFTISKILLTV